MLEPTLWREKSVTVEAMQWDGSYESQMAIVNWAWKSTGHKYVPVSGWHGNGHDDNNGYFLIVRTRHGDMDVDKNDWVVRHPDGNFYPCSPTLFELIYESDTN